MTGGSESRCFLMSKNVVNPLSADSAVVLGRDPAACNYVLSDPRVSRVHAMFFARDGAYFVKDLNSSNGTVVNDTRVTTAMTLRSGDIISIPPFTLEFVQPDYVQVNQLGGRVGMPVESRHKLEGSLSTLPITDLIQLLNSSTQSGILTITQDGMHVGDLVFADGEIIQASYEGLSGENAVYALLRNRKGRFEFTKTEPIPQHRRTRAQPNGGNLAADPAEAARITAERQIVRKTQSLLLEGCRLLDEQSTPTSQVSPDSTGVRAVIDHARSTLSG